MNEAEAELLKRFEAVMSNMTCGLLMVTMDGCIEGANSALNEMLGFGPNELDGKSLSSLFNLPGKSDSEILQRLLDCSSGGGCEGKIFTKEGTPIHVVVGCEKTGSDHALLIITPAIKSITIELGDAAAQKNIVKTSTHDMGLIELSETGIILSANKGTERLLGYGADELIGRHVSILFNSQDQGDSEFMERLTKHFGQLLNCSMLRKDGTLNPVELTISGMKGEQNLLLGFYPQHDRVPFDE